MDLQCPTCGEQWNIHHVLYDEPAQWGLSDEDLDRLRRFRRFDGGDDRARQAALGHGWKFATDSLLTFTGCPCCRNSTPLADALRRRDAVALIGELLDGDHDGMCALLEEVDVMVSV